MVLAEPRHLFAFFSDAGRRSQEHRKPDTPPRSEPAASGAVGGASRSLAERASDDESGAPEDEAAPQWWRNCFVRVGGLGSQRPSGEDVSKKPKVRLATHGSSGVLAPCMLPGHPALYFEDIIEGHGIEVTIRISKGSSGVPGPCMLPGHPALQQSVGHSRGSRWWTRALAPA
jgi:hypothetical protein